MGNENKKNKKKNNKYRILLSENIFWRVKYDYLIRVKQGWVMKTSSNGNIFRVTGPLCVEFTGHRWIPRTKASDAEL